ncbi:MAG: redoxin domain-containing protein [Candidatus Marinimicrobia bacterium]|nr:redoxin domain-containing protein [Candidatus Neomarinimicrobiota bacterium]MBL7023730.1 redoxin domain-containing protein [Candidatus Neomarinimicrobiota bacterium]MBL7109511.1 redoxin domain-containing protein [Candidatus Neomarinimicrobiota bacterium]
MNKRKLIIVGLLILVGSILFLTAQGEKTVTEEQKKAIQEVAEDVFKAPDFTLFDVNGTEYTLSKLKGKVVLVNFWATWCPPCRMEIPEFNELYTTYKNKGFEILGVSISDTQSQLTQFMKSFEVAYPVLHGSKFDISKITQMYGGIQSVPTSFIIGKDGTIIRIYPGAIVKGQPMYAYFINDLENALKVNTEPVETKF